jgi:hypothetical protein
LYNHAAGKFRGKDFQGAVKFFAATLEVCEVSSWCMLLLLLLLTTAAV